MSGIKGCSQRLSPVTELKQYNRPLWVFDEHKTQFSGRHDSNRRRASSSSFISTSISKSDCKTIRIDKKRIETLGNIQKRHLIAQVRIRNFPVCLIFNTLFSMDQFFLNPLHARHVTGSSTFVTLRTVARNSESCPSLREKMKDRAVLVKIQTVKAYSVLKDRRISAA